MMVDASMSVLNIIGAAPSQESIEHLTSVEGVGALVYYTYLAGYSGLRGAISYLNGTLVIGGRVSLWGDDSFSTGDETMLGVQGVADLLSTLPKDPTSPLSYSIIPVNAWSHNYSLTGFSGPKYRPATPTSYSRPFEHGTVDSHLEHLKFDPRFST